jgi:hypothetical protein
MPHPRALSEFCERGREDENMAGLKGNDVEETFFRDPLGLVYVCGSLVTKKNQRFALFFDITVCHAAHTI